MNRKIGTSAKSRAARKMPKRRKSSRRKKPARNSARGRKKYAENPALAGVRPPPPGRGKRGEKGYLAYLLRQAQAATRLTLERALADLGVTPPQFAVLTMLKAYPGLSGADLARVALLTPADRRRHYPQPGARRRDPEKAASGARPGAAVDADPPRRDAARQMPGTQHGPGAPPAGRACHKDAGCDPALAVQNCRGPAAGRLVP
jgi:hypothetical protein